MSNCRQYSSDFLKDRFIWQQRTIARLRINVKDAISDKAMYAALNSDKDEKTVVIYGTPQIGKTTLILDLLGISEEFEQFVYNVLRADIPKGSSSTSTAIIYRSTSDNRFGCCISDISEIEHTVDHYPTPEAFKERLKEIRKLVEANNYPDKILYIYIPSIYFSQSGIVHDNINIIDMPGDGSRNTAENANLKKILEKYMFGASINIFACTANQIQQLEQFGEALDLRGWQMKESRYMIVVTRSYCQGTVKNLIASGKVSGSFKEYITDTYTSEIKNVFGGRLKCKVFPVDIGDSYRTLLDDANIKEKDKEEIRQTKEDICEEIRNEIQAMRGNMLKTLVANLSEEVTEYTEYEIAEYNNTIQQNDIEINERNTQIRNLSKKIDWLEKDISEISAEFDKVMALNNRIRTNSKLLKTDGYIEEINKKFFDDFKDTKKIKKDKDNVISKYIRDQMSKYAADLIDKYYKPLYDDVSLFAGIDLFLEAESICDETIEDTFYIQLRELLNARWRDRSVQKCKEKTKEIFESYSSELKKTICNTKENGKKVKKLFSKYKDDLDNKKREKQISQEIMDNAKSSIKRLQAEQKDIRENKIPKIEAKRYTCRKFLSHYGETAAMEVHAQAHDITESINNSKLNTADKIMKLVLLAMIYQDYEKVRINDGHTRN